MKVTREVVALQHIAFDLFMVYQIINGSVPTEMKRDFMETWNSEEDQLLLDLIDLHGTCWKVIAGSFPTRTASSIRTRYHRIVDGSRQVGKNKCLKCGMIKRGHICKVGRVRTPDDGDVRLLISPVTEELSPPVLNTELRLEQDGDVTKDKDVSFPFHLFSWHIVHTVHDMGFDGVTHPPPLVKGFPFATSLP